MHLVSHLRALITALLVILNTILFGIPVYVLAFFKLLLRGRAAQKAIGRALIRTVEGWIDGVLLIQRWMLPIRWDIRGTEDLHRDQWYFINCNHQSWADLPILMQTFEHRIPFYKIFAKKQLIWLPIIGQALWALDYPFMQRYSREDLAQNPAKRGQDLENTRRLCRRYREAPVAILNFIEGTRFTKTKHQAQHAPYRHLLRPKAGGFAFALAALEGRIRRLLDVTIAYPGGSSRFWDYLGGRIDRVVVRVRPIEIPERFLSGDYERDPAFREDFQQWVRDLWVEKDALLDHLLRRRESN